jgi:hypothetical protein
MVKLFGDVWDSGLHGKFHTQSSPSRPCSIYPYRGFRRRLKDLTETIAVSYLSLSLILRSTIAFRLTLLAIGLLRTWWIFHTLFDLEGLLR